MKNPEFLNEVEKIASSNLQIDEKEKRLLKSCQNIVYSSETTVKINDQDQNGKTLLHIAAENNIDKLALSCIITFDADLLIKDKNGKTPLDLVTDENSPMAYLLNNAMHRNTQSTNANQKITPAPSEKVEDNLAHELGFLVIASNEEKKDAGKKKRVTKGTYLGVPKGFLNHQEGKKKGCQFVSK